MDTSSSSFILSELGFEDRAGASLRFCVETDPRHRCNEDLDITSMDAFAKVDAWHVYADLEGGAGWYSWAQAILLPC